MQIASIPMSENILALLLLIAWSVLLIYGCCCYAIAKGHSGILGGLGFLSLLDVPKFSFATAANDMTVNASSESATSE